MRGARRRRILEIADGNSQRRRTNNRPSVNDSISETRMRNATNVIPERVDRVLRRFARHFAFLDTGRQCRR